MVPPPQIVEDPVEAQQAMHRLEVVVQERINPREALTERQWEVLYAYIVLERTLPDDIGRWLGISGDTAKRHLGNIGIKLQGEARYKVLMGRIRDYYHVQLGRDEVKGSLVAR